jgi:predicted N-acetyltransferase YhbS
MTGRLEFRSGYFGDRAAVKALVDLLFDTFEIDIGQLDRMGGPDPTSMPFGYFDEAGRCVANFSAFSMPLIIDGRRVRAAGYQSGAVRPEYRGQGLYRDLMQRAFAWAEAEGFELDVLLTDKPGLYEPYGFRVVEQHMFRGSMPIAAAARPCRHLSIRTDEDVTLIRSVLAKRMPVSECFAVAGHIEEFLLNPCFDPSIRLSHMPEHDAIIAWQQYSIAFPSRVSGENRRRTHCRILSNRSPGLGRRGRAL